MATLSQRLATHRRALAQHERDRTTRLAEAKAERDQEHQERAERRKAERETEAARVKFTAADLDGARHVRDDIGWHQVVRVNTKSVTVRTGYSWDDRIPLHKVLEVSP